MKKAFMLGGLLLYAAGAYAAETPYDKVVDGKKRNEEAYEQMLRQTGWSDPKAPEKTSQAPQPKNS